MNGEHVNKRSKIFFILSIIMTLIIWINSFLPADLSGAQSGWVVGMVQSILDLFNIEVALDTLSLWVRKLAHFTEFMVLGILWFFTIHEHHNNLKKSIVSVLIIAVLTATLDETIQLFSIGRAFAVLDIGIDTLGALFGLCLCFLFTIMIHKKGESTDDQIIKP
jgi:VanZ family protein